MAPGVWETMLSLSHMLTHVYTVLECQVWNRKKTPPFCTWAFASWSRQLMSVKDLVKWKSLRNTDVAEQCSWHLFKGKLWPTESCSKSTWIMHSSLYKSWNSKLKEWQGGECHCHSTVSIKYRIKSVENLERGHFQNIPVRNTLGFPPPQSYFFSVL